MTAELDHIKGVSCVLTADSLLVLEVQKRHKWRIQPGEPPVIGLGFIGGSLAEREAPLVALQRESREEINCCIALRSAHATIAVSPEGTARHRDWVLEDVRPALIWEDPQPSFVPGAKVVVYLGQATGDPKPMDLPAILLTDLGVLLRIGAERLSVRDAAAAGGEFRQREEIPTDGILKLVGSPKILYRLSRDARDLFDEFIALDLTPRKSDGHSG